MRMGNAHTATTRRASQGPKVRRCRRAAGQRQKKTAQQPSWNSAVYLLNNPSPVNSPVQSHSLVDGSLFTARQPASVAAVQNITDSGSIVIRIDPAAAKGAACKASVTKNAVRPPA